MQEKPVLRLAYLIGSTGWGGLEMNQLNNARWMHSRGHFVLIVCVNNTPAARYVEKYTIPYVLISKHQNHYDFIRAFSLWRILTHYQIKHLIVRAVSDMSISATVSFFSRRKVKLHYFMEMQLKAKKKQWFRTIRYRHFSSWNCPLNYMKSQVISNTNMPNDRVHIIPSAVPDVFFERPNIDKLREGLELPQDEFLIGLFGRIDRKKNQQLALQALLQLNSPSLILLLIGQETPDDFQGYLSELDRYIEKNGLKEYVRFIGQVDNVADYMHAVNACLITSIEESVGMVTLEALAAGKIVIGTNSAGTKELLGEGKGFLFDAHNPEQLATLIENIKNTIANKASTDMIHHRIDSVCRKVEELLLRCS